MNRCSEHGSSSGKRGIRDKYLIFAKKSKI